MAQMEQDPDKYLNNVDEVDINLDDDESKEKEKEKETKTETEDITKDEKKEKEEKEETKDKSNDEKKENDSTENTNQVEPPKDKDKELEEEMKKRRKTVIKEDKVNTLISYFKKINIPEIDKINTDNFESQYGWFYCGQTNEANGNKCELGKEICPKCMKRTQNIYKLKPHYLINSNGRICTYKNNEIYCLGKLQRIESETKSKEGKKSEIDYCIDYTCGHTGQCEPCKNLTQIIDKYYDANLIRKLKKRDESLKS